MDVFVFVIVLVVVIIGVIVYFQFKKKDKPAPKENAVPPPEPSYRSFLSAMTTVFVNSDKETQDKFLEANKQVLALYAKEFGFLSEFNEIIALYGK